MPLKGIYTPYDILKIKKAIAYIEQHYQDNLSAERVAAEVCMDIKLLQGGLKFLTGKKVHAYQLGYKLQKAKEDLADFEKPIKLIAGQHGFCSSSHFSTEFKKQIGKTPNEYRLELIA